MGSLLMKQGCQLVVMNLEKQRQENRQAELQIWFQGILPALGESNTLAKLKPLTGDASFRRYFISTPNEQPYVLVDAPPEKEDNRTFVQVATSFLSAGLHVPTIYDVNYEKGFLCLSYLGDTLLWEKLDALRQQDALAEVSAVYHQVFESLIKIQRIREGSEILLPPFDSTLLLAEMNLFREWFCEGIMGMTLSSEDNELLDNFFELLIESALSQTQVCVHRDFHSRNLMIQEDEELGIIDFQDAVIGPFTYDLVSLIKDCYIIWPKAMIRQWALEYAEMANKADIIDSIETNDFLHDFDLMGLQRHLKAVGIFSRLYLRDGKNGYLGDIPRTLAYIKEVMADYPALEDVARWFDKKIYPTLVTKLNAAIKRRSAS